MESKKEGGKGVGYRFPPRLFADNIQDLHMQDLRQEAVYQLAILNQTLLKILDLLRIWSGYTKEE